MTKFTEALKINSCPHPRETSHHCSPVDVVDCGDYDCDGDEVDHLFVRHIGLLVGITHRQVHGAGLHHRTNIIRLNKKNLSKNNFRL